MLALSLAGCGATDGGKKDTANKKDKNQVNVVATTTQICDYVTQIAGSKDADSQLALKKTDASGKVSNLGADPAKAKTTISLNCLLAPNASAHEHDMTTAQSKALSEADVMLVNGVDLEHFLDGAVKATGFKGTMGVTSGVLTSKEVGGKMADAEKTLPYKIDRGVEKVNVRKWPFPPENGEPAEFEYDPHVWTSPKNTMVQVKNIGAILSKASPENKAIFDKHVEKYTKTLPTSTSG